MYRITNGSTQNLRDVDEFIDMLNALSSHPVAAVRKLFDPNSELFVTRAPARLDDHGWNSGLFGFAHAGIAVG